LRQRGKKSVVCKRLEESKGNKPVIFIALFAAFSVAISLIRKIRRLRRKGLKHTSCQIKVVARITQSTKRI
jgi:hypothetical protein